MKTTFKTALAAIAFAIAIVTLASCGGEGDTTKPVIVLNEPHEEEAFEFGATLRLDMDLSDNEALDQYKVEIHLAAGHTHTRATEEPPSIFTATWDDVAGLRNKNVQHDITLPAEAEAGDYHLMVYCTDRAGNESHVVRTIEIGTEGEEPHDHDH
jgi:hypothetical protein